MESTIIDSVDSKIIQCSKLESKFFQCLVFLPFSLELQEEVRQTLLCTIKNVVESETVLLLILFYVATYFLVYSAKRT